MNSRTYDFYIQKYQYGRSLTRNVDYANRKSVADNNRGVGIYRAAAEAIGRLFPERINEFAEMLNDEDQACRLACAVCILTLMEANPEINERALAVIRHIAAYGNSLDRFAWTIWLKDHAFLD